MRFCVVWAARAAKGVRFAQDSEIIENQLRRGISSICSGDTVNGVYDHPLSFSPRLSCSQHCDWSSLIST